MFQWGLILFAPGLIVPDMADISKDTSGPVTSSSSAPQLLRIPMWIDVCIHGVPAVVLVIGKSSVNTVRIVVDAGSRRFLCPGEKVQAACFDLGRRPPQRRRWVSVHRLGGILRFVQRPM
jgi:hypothetical protein